jgi:hypothetical protein
MSPVFGGSVVVVVDVVSRPLHVRCRCRQRVHSPMPVGDPHVRPALEPDNMYCEHHGGLLYHFDVVPWWRNGNPLYYFDVRPWHP